MKVGYLCRHCTLTPVRILRTFVLNRTKLLSHDDAVGDDMHSAKQMYAPQQRHQLLQMFRHPYLRATLSGVLTRSQQPEA